MSTMREVFYDIIVSDFDKNQKKEEFFNRLKTKMGKNKEIKLPMQMIEAIFDFDFHRGVHHPISSNITYDFKRRGYRITKVRNRYQARIRKL